MRKQKLLVICLVFLLVLLLAGCGNKDKAAEEGGYTAEEIDVDLTTLSKTMVYSEVFNMMTETDNYIDKVVKMEGAFAVYQDEDTGEYHYGCIIEDATACCSQGLEFILDGEYTYPEDFPEEGEKICVVGVFDVEEDGYFIYCFLEDAKMI